MKSIKTFFIFTLIIGFTSCKQQAKTETEKTIIEQSFVEHLPTAHHNVALEVISASKTWITNFNDGNAKACVKGYDEKAIMSVLPFGVKNGAKEISEFWTPFIASGATNLIYTNVSIEVVDNVTAFLSANWTMNIGRGIIYQEKWEKIDGKWLLTYDDFKVLEQYKKPKENRTIPVESHLILEDVIKTSAAWIKGFNSGKGDVCGNGYSTNAKLNAVPFASISGRDNIQGFWEKLIKDGATNLTYQNPTFRVNADNTVFLSSQWSMNIGEGKIFQEKWEKVNNEWLLTYDEFKVLKQY